MKRNGSLRVKNFTRQRIASAETLRHVPDHPPDLLLEFGRIFDSEQVGTENQDALTGAEQADLLDPHSQGSVRKLIDLLNDSALRVMEGFKAPRQFGIQQERAVERRKLGETHGLGADLDFPDAIETILTKVRVLGAIRELLGTIGTISAEVEGAGEPHQASAIEASPLGIEIVGSLITNA